MIRFLFVFILVGCASSKKKNTDPIEDKYANVVFEKVEEKKISGGFSYSGISSDSRTFLESETMSRVFQKIDDDQFENDPIGMISNACYQNNIKKFERIVRLNTKNYEKHPGFWNQIGICFLIFRQERKSLLFFNKALNIDKNFSPAKVNIYFVYLLRGEIQRSVTILEDVLKSDPNNKIAKFNLATLLLDNHIMTNANQIFQGLLSLDSNDPDLNGAIGTSYFFLKEFKKANEYFSKINSKDLTDPLWGLNHVRNLLKLNMNKEAKSLFYKIKTKDKKYDGYHSLTKSLVEST